MGCPAYPRKNLEPFSILANTRNSADDCYGLPDVFKKLGKVCVAPSILTNMTRVLSTAPPLFKALPFLEGGLTLLVVSTAFASFLIPTTILLFFFTPIHIWRSPLFIFNVLSIALGLTLQTLYVYVIVSRLTPSPYASKMRTYRIPQVNTTLVVDLPAPLVMAIVAMSFLVPVSVQGVLLVRLIGVYPPRGNTRKQNIAIYAPVVAFKIARFINAAYATRDLVPHLPNALSIIAAAQFVWSTKYIKIEWFLQLFDDMYVERPP